MKKKVGVFDFLHFHTRRSYKCPEERCVHRISKKIILESDGGHPKFPNFKKTSIDD
jgi:hypothetical protein